MLKLLLQKQKNTKYSFNNKYFNPIYIVVALKFIINNYKINYMQEYMVIVC